MTHQSFGNLLVILALLVGTVLALTLHSAFNNDIQFDLDQFTPERR